jgi:hypothetical protein
VDLCGPCLTPISVHTMLQLLAPRIWLPCCLSLHPSSTIRLPSPQTYGKQPSLQGQWEVDEEAMLLLTLCQCGGQTTEKTTCQEMCLQDPLPQVSGGHWTFVTSTNRKLVFLLHCQHVGSGLSGHMLSQSTLGC